MCKRKIWYIPHEDDGMNYLFNHNQGTGEKRLINHVVGRMVPTVPRKPNLTMTTD